MDTIGHNIEMLKLAAENVREEGFAEEALRIDHAIAFGEFLLGRKTVGAVVIGEIIRESENMQWNIEKHQVGEN